MSTLIINDLAMTEDLNRNAMAAVRGGTHRIAQLGWLPYFGQSATMFSLDASQMLGQTQSVVNNNGNNAAFVSGMASPLAPPQPGANMLGLGV